MGWYRSLVRPPLFALPPEAAHRTAHLLLGLPFPWERFGGIGSSDPTLRVELAGIELANPVGLAAGFDKTGTRLDALGRLGFGYVVGGTFTRRPEARQCPAPGGPVPRPRVDGQRDGTPEPGSRRRGQVAAEGPADRAEGGEHRRSRPRRRARDPRPARAPRRRRRAERRAVRTSRGGATATTRRTSRRCSASSGSRRVTPIFVKLPPFRTEVERQVVLALAGIAQAEGANALTVLEHGSRRRAAAGRRLRWVVRAGPARGDGRQRSGRSGG